MNKITKLALGTLVMMTCAVSSPAFAQVSTHNSGIYELGSQKQLSTSIGLNFTMPLGQKRKHHIEDKARFGFNVGLAREYGNRYSAIPTRININLLEMGYHLDGRPNLMLNGRDIYAPLFDPLYANDDEGADAQTKTKNSGTGVALGIIVGGAVVVGLAAIAGNELQNDIIQNLTGT